MPELFFYRVVEILQPAAGVKTFRLKPEGQRLSFKPGQWASWSILGPDRKPVDARPFSIASSPDADYLEFCVRMQGRFPEKLAGLKAGDVTGIRGPFGPFRLDEAADSFTFVAGGVGVAPLLSMLRWLAARKPAAKRLLLYSCRKPEEILFREELEQLARREPNFKLIITITRPEPGMNWTGRTGRINEDLLKQADPASQFYVCGPPEFSKTIREILESLSIPKERVFSEAWG